MLLYHGGGLLIPSSGGKLANHLRHLKMSVLHFHSFQEHRSHSFFNDAHEQRLNRQR